MIRFRKRPLAVEAVQWFPDREFEGLPLITDPKALVGKIWAHMGHQRELDGRLAILETGKFDPPFVHPGDWIVTDLHGERCVLNNETFHRTYEPAPDDERRLTDDQAFGLLMDWASHFDDRELTGEARRWAEEEARAVAPPENVGEWKPSLEMAFEAGRQLERIRSGAIPRTKVP